MAKRKGTREVPRSLSIKRVKTLPVDVVQDAEIARLKKEVRTLRGATEVLNCDAYGYAEVSFDTNNTYLLSSIAIGTGGTGNRIGRSVKPKSIEIRGHVVSPYGATTATEPSTVRVLLLQAKNRFVPVTSETPPALNGIFALNGAGTPYAPFSAFDASNRQHFTVLHDEMISVGLTNSTAGVSANPMVGTFHIKRKIHRTISFEDSSTDTEGGALYLCFTSNQGATVIGPEVRWFSRLLYTDA